ncbi:alanine:cation symporter family protein [Vibrio lentus]|nr:alanine:cation symporter family protein [Vibrio lentus]
MFGFQCRPTIECITLVVTSAFTNTAATGGFFGASIMLAVIRYRSWSAFSNESGLGSAPASSSHDQSGLVRETRGWSL